ncbi:acyl-CoA thioesterase II [Micrococcales bacterium 31B]|nr:acyl-CoA thioesterase II [Micrococcales bacterium 31B]
MKPLDQLISLLTGTDETTAFTGAGRQSGARVFGGQVIGQTVMAASLSVERSRPIHSMHGYFLRPGDPSLPIGMDVELLRDGSSFSQRRVHAMQHGKPILSMISSFQEEQAGVTHQDVMPSAPDPESLPTTAEVLAGIDHPLARYMATQRPIDVRHVEGPLYLGPPAEKSSSQLVWMRTMGDLPADTDWPLNRAILAFASDYTLLEVSLRAQGGFFGAPGLKMASLDHAIWFHRDFRADEWLLYEQHTTTAQGSRALCHGKLFNRSGELVASVAQEGMLRLP